MSPRPAAALADRCSGVGRYVQLSHTISSRSSIDPDYPQCDVASALRTFQDEPQGRQRWQRSRSVGPWDVGIP